jgi:hypothetical protein
VGGAAAGQRTSPAALALEVPLIALRELSKEVLQRGLLLTGLAQLLLDRAYEAGAGDVVVVPALGLGPLPTALVASYAGGRRGMPHLPTLSKARRAHCAPPPAPAMASACL